MKHPLSNILYTYNYNTDYLLFRNESEREELIQWLISEKGDELINNLKSQTDDEHSLHDSINEAILNCQKCTKNGQKKLGRGSGSNRVMVILNAPAMMTLYEKNEMRDESISMIIKIIDSLKLSMNECYITNMIKCEVDSTDKPSSYFKNCSPFIEKEIEFYQPIIVLVMGDLMPMRKIRKKYVHTNWYEIPHPITMIKNPDLKRDAWSTLKALLEFLKDNNINN
jgi:uracil-DNA glycosylase family 4